MHETAWQFFFFCRQKRVDSRNCGHFPSSTAHHAETVGPARAQNGWLANEKRKRKLQLNLKFSNGAAKKNSSLCFDTREGGKPTASPTSASVCKHDTLRLKHKKGGEGGSAR